MTDLLNIIDEAGVVAVEGAPGQPVLATADQVDRLLEACFGAVNSRFGELVAEERTRRDFGIFSSRDEARAWLAG